MICTIQSKERSSSAPPPSSRHFRHLVCIMRKQNTRNTWNPIFVRMHVTLIVLLVVVLAGDDASSSVLPRYGNRYWILAFCCAACIPLQNGAKYQIILVRVAEVWVQREKAPLFFVKTRFPTRGWFIRPDLSDLSLISSECEFKI